MDSNLIMIILDSCRYDSFKIAKTPNFDKIGKTHKCYSPGCGTLATMPEYINGSPPINHPAKIKGKGIPYGEFGWKGKFDINKLRRNGYWFGFFTANPVIFEHLSLLDNWDYLGDMDYDSKCANKIFEDIKNIINQKSRFKIMALLLETHAPPLKRGDFDSQVKAIEKVDSIFSDYIDNYVNKSRVIITSDHGELMGEKVDGERLFGHGFGSVGSPTNFHHKLFEIPYLDSDYQ